MHSSEPRLSSSVFPNTVQVPIEQYTGTDVMLDARDMTLALAHANLHYRINTDHA